MSPPAAQDTPLAAHDLPPAASDYHQRLMTCYPWIMSGLLRSPSTPQANRPITSKLHHSGLTLICWIQPVCLFGDWGLCLWLSSSGEQANNL
ncbi:hypothetical protein ACLKA7_005524 [Drosophila subpalustris]